jgi:hypothetical protein
MKIKGTFLTPRRNKYTRNLRIISHWFWGGHPFRLTNHNWEKYTTKELKFIYESMKEDLERPLRKLELTNNDPVNYNVVMNIINK